MTECLLVSACLLGERCRYNAVVVRDEAVVALAQKYRLVAVCPEVLGGMSTPRAPAERLESRVVNNRAEDVTEYFLRGAEKTAEIAKKFKCQKAILKERSPSCGCGQIYDGSFTGKLIAGKGVTADILLKMGVEVIGESSLYKVK